MSLNHAFNGAAASTYLLENSRSFGEMARTAIFKVSHFAIPRNAEAAFGSVFNLKSVGPSPTLEASLWTLSQREYIESGSHGT
jgi:hypothetical protein